MRMKTSASPSRMSNTAENNLFDVAYNSLTYADQTGYQAQMYVEGHCG